MNKARSMDSYFQQLNQTLKAYHRAIPCLLLDLDRLDQNIAHLKKDLNAKAAFRIVVKSLPSPELIDYIQKVTDTHRLMVFHQPFLTDLASRLDQHADILLGKPMPVKTAHYFYKQLPENQQGFDAYQQIQWLVDTDKRVSEYINLAKQLGRPLRLNLEIDVGLHRGGFADLEQLSAGLQLIKDHVAEVKLSGLMGYDPHVVKIPKILRSAKKAFQLANDFYSVCKNHIQQHFPTLWSDDLTFNGAGSPTLTLHQAMESPLNDISSGSCLVKPTTFDMPTLEAYQPACFIAAPVLKAFSGTTMPAMENMKPLFNMLDSTNRQSYFLYGGLWKADYHYPKGIKQNSLFGSTNQTMLNAPEGTALEVDDFVFLRPHQSEFVFLQFGTILLLRNGKLVGEWGVLRNC